MSAYSDIRDEVFGFTNRSDLAAETDFAIKQAIRAAHKLGTFWRDLVKLELTSLATDQLQSLDMSTLAPDFKQVAIIGPTGQDLQYEPIQITELYDQDRYARTDVYYGIGTNLMIRAANPASELTLVYYKLPNINPISSTTSWIAEMYPDLISLWASATILNMVGEQEVRQRVESLAGIAVKGLIEDNTTIVRR